MLSRLQRSPIYLAPVYSFSITILLSVYHGKTVKCGEKVSVVKIDGVTARAGDT
jgi:hypothetical protein